MKLIQIHNFNLAYHIKDLTIEQSQTIDKFQVDSNYIRGDYRTEKNQIRNTIFKIKGIVDKQHLIHALQSLSENDNGLGLVKCFFVEDYETFDTNYKAKNQVRFSFQYCYIDITANNQKASCNDNESYDVEFEINLKFNTTYDISKGKNTFFVTEKILSDSGLTKYDSFKKYDSGVKYDSFLTNVQPNSLFNQKEKLKEWKTKLVCCDSTENIYIYHIDTIIRPLYDENSSSRPGLISNYIDNSAFAFGDEKMNFIQVYASNPYNNLVKTLNSVDTPVNLARQGNSHTITNFNKATNTYSTNAIIQIFNANYNLALDQIQSGNVNNVFSFINQKIRIQIKNSKGELSNIAIQCTSDYILNNLKMLVIHPHRELIYGVFDTVTATFTNTSFDFDDSFKLVNLENYLLQDYLKIQNDNLNGVQEWFRLSPIYLNSFYENVRADSIKLSSEFALASQQLATNTALVCQIYSLDENNLI